MVHTLVPMSGGIKIKNFETPARLINHMELSCAVGMACRQALPCPEGTAGTDLKGIRKVGSGHDLFRVLPLTKS